MPPSTGTEALHRSKNAESNVDGEGDSEGPVDPIDKWLSEVSPVHATGDRLEP